MYGLQAEAHFDSAHFLADYYGKCENLHGHRWRIVATIEAQELQGADAGGRLRDDGTCGADGTERDMVVDFGAFKRIVGEVADELDHTFLVEEGTLKPATIAALEGEGFSLTVVPFRTTAENLARHFADELIARGLPCSQVDVYETPLNCATYRPRR